MHIPSATEIHQEQSLELEPKLVAARGRAVGSVVMSP